MPDQTAPLSRLLLEEQSHFTIQSPLLGAFLREMQICFSYRVITTMFWVCGNISVIILRRLIQVNSRLIKEVFCVCEGSFFTISPMKI